VGKNLFNLLVCNWLGGKAAGIMLAKKREYRKHRRQPMRRAAAVVLQAALSPIRCVIWDMSDGGARLAIAYPTAQLPRTFSLLLTKDASVRRNCEVVWTDARFIGVKFVSDPAAARHIPS
jgi:hypothetical protein